MTQQLEKRCENWEQQRSDEERWAFEKRRRHGDSGHLSLCNK